MNREPSLARLDLNLLVSLDALVTERSVTRAAQRLHLSQPALSASLARLRTHFGDPILARRGNEYVLTPLGIRLSTQASTALDMARRVFDSQVAWEPSTATREFTIYGSDYAFATTGPFIARRAAEVAPSVKFRFVLHSPQVVDDADEQLRTVDGLLLPHGFIDGLPFVDLWHDNWVVIAAADNPAVADGLTFETMRDSPWVLTYHSRTAFTSAARQIQQLGIEPRVETVVESFLVLPAFIAGTSRLALIQAGLAKYAAGIDAVRIFEPPFTATPVINAMWWHPVHERDPEHAWMRDLVRDAGAEFARTSA